MIAAGLLCVPALLLQAEAVSPPQLLRTALPQPVVFQQDARSALTVFQVLVPAGIRSVPADRRGLAFLAARSVMEIPSGDAVKELMEMGTQFSSWVDGDLAVLSMTALSEHFPASLKILASMLKKPLITGIRIQRVKEWMSRRERAESDSPRAVIVQMMVDHFLGAQGYAGAAMGCEKTRAGLGRRHVLDHIQAHYQSGRMGFCVVSDLDAEQVKALLETHLRLDKAAPAPEPTLATVPSAGGCNADPAAAFRELQQPLLAWGMPLPPQDARSFLLARLSARLLARGPGSIAWHLRDPLAMAYTVDCEIRHFSGGGAMVVMVRTAPEQVEPACRELEARLDDIAAAGISQQQLAAAVRLESVNWLRAWQSKPERAWLLGSFALNGPGMAVVSAYDSRLRELTLAEVNAFLSRLLARGARHRVILGKAAKEEKP